LIKRFFSGPKSWGLVVFVFVAGVLQLPSSLSAQTRIWTTEFVDSAGTDSSLTSDAEGNLHLSYRFPVTGQLKYGFREAKTSLWFKMTVDNKGYGDFSTYIVVDSQSDPYICYSPSVLKFAHFDGHRWSVQQIDPNGGLVLYTCSLSVGSNGMPQVSWCGEGGTYLRYAVLKDGTWYAQTADMENKPGKWNSMSLDSRGLPHLSYTTAVKGQLRYSYYTGTNWIHSVVDAQSPLGEEKGMGNSIVLDSAGNPMISYYETQALKFASHTDGKWKVETIEEFPASGAAPWKSYRSKLVLGQNGNPHVGFLTPMGLEHAWRDGDHWRKELVIRQLGNIPLDCSMALDANDTLYFIYTDSNDRSLKMAVGRVVATNKGKAEQEPPK
jgi:hypothetical protein